MGYPYRNYFLANVDEWLRECRTCLAHVLYGVATHLPLMSASTMGC